MWIAGVDENGMGPRLGPLVATSVLIEVAKYDQEALRELGLKHRLGDSKQTSAFGHMAHAEGFALALAERFTGKVPKDGDALLDALALGGTKALRTPCPKTGGATKACWFPLPLPAFGGDIEAGRALLTVLDEAGVTVHRLRTTLACAGSLNDHYSVGRNKVAIDLRLFEDLLVDAADFQRECLGQAELEAYCGIIGGLRKYLPRFDKLNDAAVLVEEKGRSSYRVGWLGNVHFEVKADDRHLPVGMASMVGKYIREIAMERMMRFYRNEMPELRPASGYHDPVTRAFVEQTEALRKRLVIRKRCFER